jgi:hypothetical protein
MSFPWWPLLCTVLVCDSVYNPIGSGLRIWTAWEFMVVWLVVVATVLMFWWQPK